MQRPYRLIREADDEVLYAAMEYNCDVLGRGQRFYRRFQETLSHAAQVPMTGRRVPPEFAGSHDVRAFPLSRFPYTLYAVVRSDEIIVVAVAHQKRLPGYWIDRLASVDNT